VVRQDLANAKQELQTAIDNLALRLTVRLAITLAAGIAALGVIVKLNFQTTASALHRTITVAAAR
jgi:hypothetical protein